MLGSNTSVLDRLKQNTSHAMLLNKLDCRPSFINSDAHPCITVEPHGINSVLFFVFVIITFVFSQLVLRIRQALAILETLPKSFFVLILVRLLEKVVTKSS